MFQGCSALNLTVFGCVISWNSLGNTSKWPSKTWFARKPCTSTMMPINLPIYNFEFNNLDHRPVAKSFLPRFRAISHRDYLIYNCTSAKIYTKIVQTTCFIGSTSDTWYFVHVEETLKHTRCDLYLPYCIFAYSIPLLCSICT